MTAGPAEGGRGVGSLVFKGVGEVAEECAASAEPAIDGGYVVEGGGEVVGVDMGMVHALDAVLQPAQERHDGSGISWGSGGGYP